MATVGRRTLLVNGKRRKRRNRARRKMSARQIRFFGSKAQRAALKRRKPRHNRKARRNAPRKTAHRPRTRPRTAPRKKHRRRKNVSEIITASLAGFNPGGRRRKTKAKTKRRRTSMAKTRRKKSAGRRVNRKHYSARRTRRNPRRHRHVSHRRRSVKRNPGRMGGGITSVLIDAGWAGAGAVASRAIPNMLLTSMNSGVVGYGANIITGLALAWGARSFLKNSRAAADIMLGTMIGVIFRAVQDFTPYGKYAALNGMGDFQMTEFFSPRILGINGSVDSSQSLIAAGAARNAAAAHASASRGLAGFYNRSFGRR